MFSKDATQGGHVSNVEFFILNLNILTDAADVWAEMGHKFKCWCHLFD